MHALAIKRLLVDLLAEEHARAPKQIILYLCDTAATIFSRAPAARPVVRKVISGPWWPRLAGLR